MVFLPCIHHMVQDVHVDVVWNALRKSGLKAQTRQNRGSGNRPRGDYNTNIPVNWKNFLHCDANKVSLFQLLANAIQVFPPPPQKQAISIPGQNAVVSLFQLLANAIQVFPPPPQKQAISIPGQNAVVSLFQLLANAIQVFPPPPQKQVHISIHGQNAVSSPIADLLDLSCTHEEADTRLLFPAFHVCHHGFTMQQILTWWLSQWQCQEADTRLMLPASHVCHHGFTMQQILTWWLSQWQCQEADTWLLLPASHVCHHGFTVPS